MHLSTQLALIGISLGVLLNCLFFGNSDELAMDIAVLTFVYGVATAGIILSVWLSSLRPWILSLAAVPLLLWTLLGTLGAGDPNSILAFILYSAAIVVAFGKERQKLK